VLDGGGAQSNPRLDGFAYWGAEPVVRFVAHRQRDESGRIVRDERGRALGRVVIRGHGHSQTFERVNPWDVLSRFYEAHTLPGRLLQPNGFPFRAGLVGYVG